VDLIDGRRTFRAVSSATAGMRGIALELANLHRLLVYPREQTARGLAIETNGGDQHVLARLFAGPRFRVVFDPIVPHFGRRILLHPVARVGVLYWQTQNFRH